MASFDPQPHDGTFAKLLFDLLNARSMAFVAFVVAIFYSAPLVGHDGCSVFCESGMVAYTAGWGGKCLAVTLLLVSLARSEWKAKHDCIGGMIPARSEVRGSIARG